MNQTKRSKQNNNTKLYYCIMMIKRKKTRDGDTERKSCLVGVHANGQHATRYYDLI